MTGSPAHWIDEAMEVRWKYLMFVHKASESWGEDGIDLP